MIINELCDMRYDCANNPDKCEECRNNYTDEYEETFLDDPKKCPNCGNTSKFNYYKDTDDWECYECGEVFKI